MLLYGGVDFAIDMSGDTDCRTGIVIYRCFILELANFDVLLGVEIEHRLYDLVPIVDQLVKSRYDSCCNLIPNRKVDVDVIWLLSMTMWGFVFNVAESNSSS